MGYEEEEKSEYEEKEMKKEGKRENRVEIQETEKQLVVLNEVKLMNEENCIKTTKMRKNLKKLMKKFAKREKIAGMEMQETIEKEWKAETREKRKGKEEVEEKSENNFIS